MRRALLSVILTVIAAPAMAQSEVEQLERSLRQAEQQYALQANPALNIGERALLEYGALVNFSFLAIDDVGGNTHILRQTDTQVFGRLNIDGAHEFFGRARYTYRDFNSGDSFDGKGDESLYPIFDRWHYRFDLRRAIAASEGRKVDYNVTLTVGRQFVDWASGLVLSDQLYAARGVVEVGPIEFEYLAGITAGSSVIDFDSSRPSFDGDTDRGFYGGKITFTGLANHRPYVYAIHQADYNSEDNFLINIAGTGFPTSFQYDSTYIAVGSTGSFFLPNLVYMAEAIYEFGSGLSSSITPTGVPLAGAPQTKEDIAAWAGKFELNYLVRDANLTRLEFELLMASGDSDRDLDTSNTVGGNLSGTRDTAFNAFGFARTGLAFAAPFSNLLSFRGGISTYPLRNAVGLFRDLQVGADVLVLNKMSPSGPLDEPTNDSRFLGIETDFFATWRVTSDVSVNLRYGVFFPGQGIATDHDARHFLYTGVTYAF